MGVHNSELLIQFERESRMITNSVLVKNAKFIQEDLTENSYPASLFKTILGQQFRMRLIKTK